MLVRHDLAVFIDDEARPHALRGKHPEKEIALVDHARNVHGGRVAVLVDIDIVLLVRAKAARAMRRDGIAPQLTVRGNRPQKALHVPVAVRGNQPEAPHQEQSHDECAWSHKASFLNSSYTARGI